MALVLGLVTSSLRGIGMCNHTSAYSDTEVACYRRPSGHWWVPPSVVLELTKREVDGGGVTCHFSLGLQFGAVDCHSVAQIVQVA